MVNSLETSFNNWNIRSFTGKYEQLQKNASEAFRTLKDQKELITQLEADLLNIRGLPSSAFRGEGVGAPSPALSSSNTATDTELMSKAVSQIGFAEDERMYFWSYLFSSSNFIRSFVHSRMKQSN